MVFHASRLVFHGFRSVLMVFHGPRLVFHGFRAVLMVFQGSRLTKLTKTKTHIGGMGDTGNRFFSGGLP